LPEEKARELLAKDIKSPVKRTWFLHITKAGAESAWAITLPRPPDTPISQEGDIHITAKEEMKQTY